MKKVLALLVLCSILPGCALLFGGGSPDPQWQEDRFQNVPWDDLWMISLEAMNKAQYKAIQQDPGEGKIVSAWRYELSPYSRQEKRTRATLLFDRKPDQVIVKVRVEMERNKDMSKTMNPEGADWKPVEDDADQARFILRYMIVRTRTFGPSPEFYEKQKQKQNG